MEIYVNHGFTNYLKFQGTKGLTNLLAGQSTLEEVTSYAGSDLTVIPCGPIPPNPSELISFKSYERFNSKLTTTV